MHCTLWSNIMPKPTQYSEQTRNGTLSIINHQAVVQRTSFHSSELRKNMIPRRTPLTEPRLVEPPPLPPPPPPPRMPPPPPPHNFDTMPSATSHLELVDRCNMLASRRTLLADPLLAESPHNADMLLASNHTGAQKTYRWVPRAAERAVAFLRGEEGDACCVLTAAISEKLEYSERRAYLNVRIKEGTDWCLEIDSFGFLVCGRAFDTVDQLAVREPTAKRYRKVPELLRLISPQFNIALDAMIAKYMFGKYNEINIAKESEQFKKAYN